MIVCNFVVKTYRRNTSKNKLAEASGLPMFLHNRASSEDMANMLRENRSRFTNAVVHSFDGTLQEAKMFLDLGLYIGVNGCSLKKQENLEVVQEIPLERLLLETDCPWCEIRPSHASSQYVRTKFEPAKKKDKFERGCFVKNRIEPLHIVQVAEVVAGLKGVPVEEVARIAFENSMSLFFPSEKAV
eukprot:Rmarinus@m.18849